MKPAIKQEKRGLRLTLMPARDDPFRIVRLQLVCNITADRRAHSRA
jgi:hypothetical protein